MLEPAPLTAATTPAVSVRNLRKSFGALEVLKGISFDAREGEVISVLGSSGSGNVSFVIGTGINCVVVPGGNVTIPGVRVKSMPSPCAAVTVVVRHTKEGAVPGRPPTYAMRAVLRVLSRTITPACGSTVVR